MALLKRHCYKYIVWMIGLLGAWPALQAQRGAMDTAYRQPYKRTNVLESSIGSYSTKFNFRSKQRPIENYRLSVNSSGFLSAYVNYKWLSLQYSFNIPGTHLDNNVKFKYTSIRFRISTGAMVFHPFYDSYNGLLIPQRERSQFKPFQGIRFTDAGLDYSYYLNSKRFSFRAANTFTERQLRSAGSLFVMATPMWQKINWLKPVPGLVNDSMTYHLLARSPEWLSMVVRAGYAYNIALAKGRWLIAPAAMAGVGILREINTSYRKLDGITDLQAWVNAGYNGTKKYLYLSASWSNLNSYLLTRNMQQVNTNLSVTVGYRFGNYPQKLLGIL